MSSMNKTLRAEHYLDLLIKSKNKEEEALKIITEVNDLVWSGTEKKLTKQEKLEILEEVTILFNLRSLERGPIVEAGDNSKILDVISLMKRRVKD